MARSISEQGGELYQQLQRSYADARTAENKRIQAQNSAADALVEFGPTSDLTSFLFAMHGILRTSSHYKLISSQQKQYERVEALFGEHTALTVFRPSWKTSTTKTPPAVYMLGQKFQDKPHIGVLKPRENPVQYEVTKRGNFYLGTIAVSALMSEFGSDESIERRSLVLGQQERSGYLSKADFDSVTDGRDMFDPRSTVLFSQAVLWHPDGYLRCNLPLSLGTIVDRLIDANEQELTANHMAQ